MKTKTNAKVEIETINAALGSPALLDMHNEFEDTFGNRFDTYFTECERAIERLKASKLAVPLSLMDTLPAKLITQLRDLSSRDKGLVAKKMVAKGFSRLVTSLESSVLPLSILRQYPGVVRYMISSIVDDTAEAYGNEAASYFDRDMRMVSGLTVPAGAQIVDLRCKLPTSLYRYRGIRENLRCLSFVTLHLGGLGPLLRIHTDTRNLLDFNQSGWDDCYVRIGELMKLMPEVKGMVGTSWFYDPQLAYVSPRLAYLRSVPLLGGAFLHIDGPGEIHTQRAITRSPTRKQMYLDGKYLPVCATLVWARKDMIRWASEKRA